MAEKLGPEMCEALPGLHAFTGCDSTSAFSGKGKRNPLKLCKNNPDLCEGLTMLGQNFEIHDDTLKECERFACRLYGSSQSDINECRYFMFCTKNCLSQSLPPCKDALKNHTKRANYQAGIWRRALDACAEIPNPQGHGWDVDERHISITWLTLPPAPMALLELIVCGCTKAMCKDAHCTCSRNKLSCTDACKCGVQCQNIYNVFDLDGDD